MAAVAALMPSGRAQQAVSAGWTDSNPETVVHRPRTVSLRPDEITAVMAFDAQLRGNLRPPPQPRASLNADFAVPGFTGPGDSMTWTVRVAADDEYAVSLLYNGANEILRGGALELAASPSGTTIRLTLARTLVGACAACGWHAIIFPASCGCMLETTVSLSA